ncbi:MAG TPA: UDP-N-acetylmuramate dehydrogenase [Niabella sp.]|nr:UDP-N-acetylmuramate dehydrogenase [Niabella sp.]
MTPDIKNNISLKPYNTFGIDVRAEHFAVAETIDDVKACLQWANAHEQSTLILGGGSNVLFTGNVTGLVLQNAVKGIEKVYEDDHHVYLKVGGGEVWHRFVLYCLDHNYAGIENLALIPGRVGASPMQNIGAYGVEIKEVFQELTAIHRHSLERVSFSNGDCEFGYRESVFKHRYKNEFVITDVTYKLAKKPQFNIGYGAIKQELEKAGVKDLSIRAIADAVIAIRSSKLPDPRQIGNAGSFFKNPSVDKEKYLQLKEIFPSIVAYENPNGTMKLAAGWLIEQSGLKGFRKGDAGVHEKQALVLVNYGKADGTGILKVCGIVQDAVMNKFGVMLLPEVNIL